MIALLLTASFSQLFGWGEGLSPSVKLPLRPPSSGITVPPLSNHPVRYRWDSSGALSCPYMDGVEIPLCGQIFDLYVEQSGSIGDHVQGRAVVCAKDRSAYMFLRAKKGDLVCLVRCSLLVDLSAMVACLFHYYTLSCPGCLRSLQCMPTLLRLCA
jgi:hypothetical protein